MLKILPLFAALLTPALFASLVAGPTKYTVTQSDRKFSSTELAIHTGDTVVFVNNDDVSHNIYSNSEAGKFDNKTQSRGNSTPVTFQQEGTIEVRCAIHPSMKLTIRVTKPADEK